MAKRGRKTKSDHVPENPLADYLQKHTFTHTVLNGAGPSVNSITTGMKKPLIMSGPAADDVMVEAWDIHHVSIRPCVITSGNVYPYAAGGAWCLFQLLYDTYTDVVNESAGDFDDVIAGGGFHLDLATSGANSHFWPMFLDIASPRPVFAENLTFASESPDVVGINGTIFTVTIWYAPIYLTASGATLLLAARARL